MLDQLNSADLRQLLTRAGLPGVQVRQDAGATIVLSVRSSDFVPDGLALAGHPAVANELLGIVDYPTFDLTLSLPDDGLSGFAALAAWGELLSAAAREIRIRIEEVGDQVTAARTRFETEAAAPWHITGFDPYTQRISLGGRTLVATDCRRTGQLEDLSRLFLGPLLATAESPAKIQSRARIAPRWATVDSAQRGGHIITVMTGRRQSKRVRVDLLRRAVIKGPVTD
ncbi:hypothetical protein RKE25_22425 (plasmid) [Dyella sp. BiH032]|uniref:hypothetical protein n=1 Tax=Dyella sp. BiH032 TaxID=3075430 RepID=UPI002892F40C|nr:hypothetical protein [Dyella sp. BiH032]WNL48489.1 hypothetical protein RKE25_22425 [Dyella sp. BiH032]